MPSVTLPTIQGFGGTTSIAAIAFYGWVIGHPLSWPNNPTGLDPKGYTVSYDSGTELITVTWDENDPDFMAVGSLDVWVATAPFTVRIGIFPHIDVSATATRDETFGVSLDISSFVGLTSSIMTEGTLDGDYDWIGIPDDVAHDYRIDWGDGTVQTISPSSEQWTDAEVDDPPVTIHADYVASLTATHQFAGPGSSTGIVVSLVFSGQAHKHTSATPNIKPKALFTATALEDEDFAVALDASASYDIDGTLVDYDWTYGGAGAQGGTPPITPEYAYNAQGTYTVSLTVTDNRGMTDSTTQSVTVEAAKTIIGLADMPDNTVYGAVNSGNDVQVYKIAGGI